ncbi:MAG: ribosome-binding factor A [Candidatus Latescibacterota bacterium]|jgi:ribosome-binding factor A
MASYRPESVGRNIQVELSNILRQESKDPSLKDLTITGVKMSKDLRTAKVYISAIEDRKEEILEGLARANSFLRHQVAQRVQMRHVPELFFAIDNSLAYASRIEQLLSQLDT